MFYPVAWKILTNLKSFDSIANPHLNDDTGTIIAFPGQRFDVALGMLPPVEVPALDTELLGRDTTISLSTIVL